MCTCYCTHQCILFLRKQKYHIYIMFISYKKIYIYVYTHTHTHTHTHTLTGHFIRYTCSIACLAHLLMLLPAGWCTVSQSSNHLRLVSWTWKWVHFTQTASTVTRSQSNRAPLGCGGMRYSHHGCAADKSAATAWCYHVNMDPNL